MTQKSKNPKFSVGDVIRVLKISASSAPARAGAVLTVAQNPYYKTTQVESGETNFVWCKDDKGETYWVQVEDAELMRPKFSFTIKAE